MSYAEWFARLNQELAAYWEHDAAHWLTCASDPTSCPILPGDTPIRLVSIKPHGPEPKVLSDVVEGVEPSFGFKKRFIREEQR